MIKTPLARAAFTTSFMRGAISPTRSVAPLHQCWFHMSQMMMAVFFESNSIAFSSTRHSPVLGADSTRFRVFSLSDSAASSAFFGAPADDGWFLNWHCYDEFIKVAFFRGALLDPPPPEPSKMKDVRYWHIRENQPLDEKRFSAWLAQAIRLPGERM